MSQYSPKTSLADISTFAFQVFSISYLVFLIIDYTKENYISEFFNFNGLLLVIVISAILSFFLRKNEQHPRQVSLSRKYILVTILSLASTLIIFKITYHIGWLGYLIAILAGIIMFLATMSLIEKRSFQKNSKFQQNIETI